MAFVDFSKFYHVNFTTLQPLSREGLNALTELGRRSDVAAAITATDVPLTPTGAITSTNLQDAVTELDLEKQASDPTLTALAGAATAADKLIYWSGVDVASVTDFSAFARTILDDVDAAAVRATLGLGTLATQSGTFSGTSSGTNTGDQDLSGLVPKTTTVNGHALSANVTVTPADLGLVIGTNVQAWDADLDAWALKTAPAGDVLGTTDAQAVTNKTVLESTGYVKSGSTVVGSLPAAATAGAGARHFVTDANATTFLSIVAGGGTNKVPVVSNGTNWLIG